jgi:hypothetical protein
MKQNNPHAFLAFIRRNWFYIIAIPLIIYFWSGILFDYTNKTTPNTILQEYVHEKAKESESKADQHRHEKKMVKKKVQTIENQRLTTKKQKNEALQQITNLAYDSLYKRVLWAADATDADIRAAYENSSTTSKRSISRERSTGMRFFDN